MKNSKPNSIEVKVEFTTPAAARRFYFDAPGEGYANGNVCFKCVEGNREAARRLYDMTGRLASVKSMDFEWYDVEVETQTNPTETSKLTTIKRTPNELRPGDQFIDTKPGQLWSPRQVVAIIRILQSGRGWIHAVITDGIEIESRLIDGLVDGIAEIAPE